MYARYLMVMMLLFTMALPSITCAGSKTFTPILLQPEQSIYAIKSIIIGNNTQTLVGNKIQDEYGQPLPDDYYRLIEKHGDKFEATSRIMRIKGGVITENSGNITVTPVVEEVKKVAEKESVKSTEIVKHKSKVKAAIKPIHKGKAKETVKSNSEGKASSKEVHKKHKNHNQRLKSEPGSSNSAS